MTTITVKLPRECGGKEILEAFRKAATFDEGPRLKWQCLSTDADLAVATTDATFVRDKGYIATPAFLKKPVPLFGRRPKWKTRAGVSPYRFETQVCLLPISPEGRYEEVKIKATHIGKIHEDSLGTVLGISVVDPDSVEFPYRDAYDRIVRSLLERL